MWHGRTDERTDGHKNFWSLTFVSMTHVSIMSLRYIVSEVHTDRQAKYIYRYICMPEYLPGTQGILAYLLETNVSFSVLCLCVYEFSLDLFCTFILMYIL